MHIHTRERFWNCANNTKGVFLFLLQINNLSPPRYILYLYISTTIVRCQYKPIVLIQIFFVIKNGDAIPIQNIILHMKMIALHLS